MRVLNLLFQNFCIRNYRTQSTLIQLPGWCNCQCALLQCVRTWIRSPFKMQPFLAHLAKGHVSFCHHLASVVCPSVIRRKLSHFNLLLRNHWPNCNQTLLEWFLDGPLPKLCPVIATSNQDGHQAKNRKKGDEILIVHCCFSISQNELKF